jgi:hypothetical protein
VVVVEVVALLGLYIAALKAAQQVCMVGEVEVLQGLLGLRGLPEKALYVLCGPEILGLTQAQTQGTCNGLVYSNS